MFLSLGVVYYYRYDEVTANGAGQRPTNLRERIVSVSMLWCTTKRVITCMLLLNVRELGENH